MPSTKKSKVRKARSKSNSPSSVPWMIPLDECTEDMQKDFKKGKEVTDDFIVLRKVPTDGRTLLETIRGPLQRADLIATSMPDLDQLIAWSKEVRDQEGPPKEEEMRLFKHEGGIFPTPVGLASFATGSLDELSDEQRAAQPDIHAYLKTCRDRPYLGVCDANSSRTRIISTPSPQQRLSWLVAYLKETDNPPESDEVQLVEHDGGRYPFAIGKFYATLFEE